MTTTFTLDLNTALTQVLAQHTGSTTTRFLPGIGQQVNGAWQYLHADALGNLRQVTDATGALLGSRRYSPFGEVVAGSGSLSPLGFTGARQDATSGLTYLRARYYSATLGRFLTPDSIVPNAANGQAWNAYAYVYNDVVNRVDPSGFAPGPLSGEFWSNWGQQIGRGVAVVNNWWNKPTCGCATVSAGQAISQVIGTVGGPVAIAYKIQTFMRTQTQQITTRSMNFSFTPDNQVIRGGDIYRDPTSGQLVRPNEAQYSQPVTRVTESEVGAFDLRGAGKTTQTYGVGSDGAPLMTVATRFTNKTLWKGLMRGGVWGLGLNALGTFAQDLWNNPCRAPREFALNMATSITYGLVPAIGASLFGAALFGFGAPMAAVTVGTYLFGVGLSLGVDYARAKYGLPDFEGLWRQRNR